MCEGNAAVKLHRGPGPKLVGKEVQEVEEVCAPTGGGAEQAVQLKELTEASIKRTC